MKLVAMKLTCLFAALTGALLLAMLLGFVQTANLATWYDQYVPEQVRTQLTLLQLEEGLAILLIVLGIYGFVPKFSRKKERNVSFHGEHGDVIVHLDMVESTITRVLSNVPEVKKINVRVIPDKKGRKASIVADCVLHDRPEVPARQAADLVEEYLRSAAGNILGVEDVESVKLHVVGIEVDAKKSSQYLEEDHNARLKALEAKRLPPAPGLLAGAAPLAIDAQLTPLAAEPIDAPTPPLTGIPEAEPIEDTANNSEAPIFPAAENQEDAPPPPFEVADEADDEPKQNS